VSNAWGIDGYRKGWIAVAIGPQGKCRFELIGNTATLAALDPAMTMIDIPIGLPERGYRDCDKAARALLKGAQSRVFLGLRRPLLGYLDNYAAANAWAKEADGKGLAKQAFAILPKIAAIDRVMSPERQERFRESHPELVFARLNGGAPLISKHVPDGLCARRDILARHGFDDIDRWLGQLRGTGAKPDDLLDACVLAVAANEALAGQARRVAGIDRRDAKGLRMEIWY
jgi:predicted RNase H-like nuclease